MRSTLAVVSCLLSAPALAAPDVNSANFILPHCRAAQRLDKPPGFMSGLCAGIVDALVGVSSVLPQGMRFCPPPDSTNAQQQQVCFTRRSTLNGCTRILNIWWSMLCGRRGLVRDERCGTAKVNLRSCSKSRSVAVPELPLGEFSRLSRSFIRPKASVIAEASLMSMQPSLDCAKAIGHRTARFLSGSMLRHSGATIPSGPLPGKTLGNASVFGLRTTLKF